MSQQQPLLFDLFILMREEAKLPLTIDQYYMLLQALQGGFGISSRHELKQICRLLWIKSTSSPQVERFEQCFAQYFAQYSESLKPRLEEISSRSSEIARDKIATDTTDKIATDATDITDKIVTDTIATDRDKIATDTTDITDKIARDTIATDTDKAATDSSPSSPTTPAIPDSDKTATDTDTDTDKAATDSPPSSPTTLATPNSDKTTTDTDDSPPSNPATPAAPDYKSANSPQIATAIRGELLPEQPFTNERYQLTLRDFPVTQRQIQQNWRYLRRAIREGALTEIDIEATVEQISQGGIFSEPVLIPSHVNRVEMLLLIDDSNSMVPFRLLSQRIVATLQGSRLGKADTYYFRNSPRDYLYLYPRRPDAEKINELLPKLHCNRTVVLIISDGGAARGGINRDRIQITEEFVEQFTPYVRHFAWLNPIPSQRWQYTSAGEISRLVPMFELNYQGFQAAMRSLKI